MRPMGDGTMGVATNIGIQWLVVKNDILNLES
jgi:hypothetical protein